jgi:hypothetical protein
LEAVRGTGARVQPARGLELRSDIVRFHFFHTQLRLQSVNAYSLFSKKHFIGC